VSLELATANLESLLKVMRVYERAQGHFNSIVEEADMIDLPIRSQPDANALENIAKQLEVSFRRKLHQPDLNRIGTTIARLIGPPLGREAKRSRKVLLEWFAAHWTSVQQKIIELRLPETLFPER
jgi:hypothetical protein